MFVAWAETAIAVLRPDPPVHTVADKLALGVIGD